MWHLTPDLAVPPKWRIVERLELYPNRVHCSRLGCRWSCPCRDITDAEDVLSDHLTQAHPRSDA